MPGPLDPHFLNLEMKTDRMPFCATFKMQALHRVVVGALALCASSAFAQTFPVTVDSCGEKLTFAAPPKAALVHDINMTDMALALGLQKSMVGVSGITGWYKMSPEFKLALGNIKEIAPKQPTILPAGTTA
jgi:iron complex transport system substrate-binding protein